MQTKWERGWLRGETGWEGGMMSWLRREEEMLRGRQGRDGARWEGMGG